MERFPHVFMACHHCVQQCKHVPQGNKLQFQCRNLGNTPNQQLLCVGTMSVRRNFSMGERRHFAYYLQVADDAMQTDVHRTLPCHVIFRQ